jgi:hypothetical protein
MRSISAREERAQVDSAFRGLAGNGLATDAGVRAQLGQQEERLDQPGATEITWNLA